ncbi:glutathione hydrolase 7-like isoform X2 [Prorops nasuta]|uniref:glutathione hydrolase 7-like isoform X2 n=1 Tax=Prorops nasuta TaxID=863751 RepID=UPI0034CDA110
MHYCDNQLSEDCPLTKDKTSKYKCFNCCKGGLKLIVCCFTLLTLSITATLVFQLLYSNNTTQIRRNHHGAVATDYTNCSQIGTKILRYGGNAVDAAIAATICMTVVAPHKTGLGGGGYIMIYNHKDQTNPIIIDFATNTNEGTFASINERIPAVLRGLEFALILHGKLSWKEVISPSAKLAREGFIVSKELADEISKNSDFALLYGHLNPGEMLRLEELANTLDELAEYGTNVFYNGSLSKKVLYRDTVNAQLLKELAAYEPLVYTAHEDSFYGYTIYYPQSAENLYRALAELKHLNFVTNNASEVHSQFVLAETLINTNPISSILKQTEEEKYTGVMAMDWQDTYVAALTGLSTSLGSGYITEAGFLLDKGNNNNFSTFTPIIFKSKKSICGLRGIFGSDNNVLNVQILYNLLIQKMNVSTSIEYPRYYLLPDGMTVEHDHSIKPTELNIPISHIDAITISKSVNVIIKTRDSMTSHSDSRGGGIASRF